MDQVLYWLDHSLGALQHAWIWACVTAVLATATIVGIAVLAHRYDGAPHVRA